MELVKLSEALEELDCALRHAANRVREAYPAGTKVVVRTKRFGYPAKEHAGEVRSARVDTSGWGSSVILRVKNCKTGKVSPRYPGLKIDGLPQVRLAEEEA